ncbi:helix-turn-helix transcriptional regulator [Paenibacillus sinopodophylli]|uniref:helix-turn-helix transcriptional regulator n=1 Tax=Paenibacillus sinopodophylli TaxID=1837342 RepID=UPI00110CF5AA|nr:helix-turn-helix transcriptional regulator [Paenibacillus sinopodophylli]
MVIKLKQLRKRKGWTQPVTAMELGVSLDTIKHIETQGTFVSKRTLTQIYKIFECKSFDEIFEAV